MASAVRFNKIRDGHYVEPVSGIELVKGIDDSDGYDRIEWQIWTPGGPRCATSVPLGVRPSLNEAKAQVRKHLAARTS